MYCTTLIILVFVALALCGCKEDPISHGLDWSGSDLLANGEFRPAPGLADAPDIIGTSMLPGWKAATGTPQICTWAGFDGQAGFLRMWGAADTGESVSQTLAAGIRAGRRYRVAARIAWAPPSGEPSAPYATVRFLAFNTAPGTAHWNPEPGNVAVIGELTIADSVWLPVSTALWTAETDYSGFAITVENQFRENNDPGNRSWAVVDDVRLIEVAAAQ